jgi:hypothetical protein
LYDIILLNKLGVGLKMSLFSIPGSWVLAPRTDEAMQGAAGPAGPAGPAGADGVATPTGVNKQVQYNANGNFGANASFTFDSSTRTLYVEHVETESIAPPSSLTGTYTISSPTTITLDPESEIINAAPMKLLSRTVSQLSSLSASVGSLAFCTNASGGSIPVFYDGSSWRKMSDRSIVA